MKALVAHSYGDSSVLAVEDVPIPLPGPGQLQVRITATALNPADLRLLGGAMAEVAPLTFPHTPGIDFAGTVTGTGPGVTQFALGDEVFGCGFPRSTVGAVAAVFSDPPSLTTGTLAEYAVFEADTPALAHRPPALTAERAAALPTVGLTGLAVLRAGQFKPDETVLVIGAAGGVGSALVPLLATAGVRVLATARAADEAYVRALGATDVIDHRTADVVAETARRYPEGVDAVLNLALPGPELTAYAPLVRPGGRLLNVAFPSPDPADFADRDLTVSTVYAAARPGDLDDLAARAVAGTLPEAIGRRDRLTDAPRAFRALEREHTQGKLIVLADPGDPNGPQVHQN